MSFASALPADARGDAIDDPCVASARAILLAKFWKDTATEEQKVQTALLTMSSSAVEGDDAFVAVLQVHSRAPGKAKDFIILHSEEEPQNGLEQRLFNLLHLAWKRDLLKMKLAIDFKHEAITAHDRIAIEVEAEFWDTRRQ
jgi:hypothetical protein